MVLPGSSRDIDPVFAVPAVILGKYRVLVGRKVGSLRFQRAGVEIAVDFDPSGNGRFDHARIHSIRVNDSELIFGAIVQCTRHIF